MSDWRSIEIPKRMRTLEKDHRGYPVPYIIQRDRQGIPHFALNDDNRVSATVVKRLCHVCGKRLERTKWFVGGIVGMSKRIFFDGPLHEECARYALQVCPYLAAPNYGKYVGLGTMNEKDRALLLTHRDPDITNTRPERFGLGQTADYNIYRDRTGMGFRFLAEPWLHQEWWKDGQCVEVAIRS